MNLVSAADDLLGAVSTDQRPHENIPSLCVHFAQSLCSIHLLAYTSVYCTPSRTTGLMPLSLARLDELADDEGSHIHV